MRKVRSAAVTIGPVAGAAARVTRDLLSDVRHAGRALLRAPAFAAVVVLSLGLGIGADTALFSLLDAVLLRSLPIDAPGRLVALTRELPGKGTIDTWPYPAIRTFDNLEVFESVTASASIDRAGVRADAAGGGGVTTVGLVSSRYFATLGVGAAAGRTLSGADDAQGAPVAVISAGYWRRRFSRVPDVVGRTLVVNDIEFTVVGVAARSFEGEEVGSPTDVWVPVGWQDRVMPERPGLATNARSNWIRILARLRPGVSVAAAEAAARAAFARSGFSPNSRLRLNVEPAGRGFSVQRETLARPLVALAAVAGLVLLLACANVATLLLARASARGHEIAIRLAVGASRWRVARQLLAESVLLTVAAAAAGFVVAAWMTRALAAIVASGRVPFAVEVQPDGRMLLLSGALGIATCLLFGVAPAWRASRVVAGEGLASSAGLRRAAGPLRGGAALVVAQVAVSLVLVCGAGLFARTLRNLETQHLGFERTGVYLFWLAPEETGRQRDALVPLFEEAERRVSRLPGVASASVSSDGVLSGFVGLRPVALDGRAMDEGERVNAQWNLVGPRFFETIGMRILRGRGVGAADTAASAPVAVINESMARYYFGADDPVGRRFRFGRDLGSSVEIVGVVENAKYFSARDSGEHMVFLPYRQDTGHLYRMCVIVRTAPGATATLERVASELRAVAPGVPLRTVNTTGDQLERTLVDERLASWLSTLFAGLAVALSCIGLYGVLAYAVERRGREIGIRATLGATRWTLRRSVVADAIRLAATGIALGVPGAIAGSRAVASLLFGVAPSDPLTLAAASGLFLAVAILAAAVPAWRASTVDPVIALRSE